MAKRFTDTEKWKKPWFRKLEPKMKCAWQFLLDDCDHAGIWHEDMEMLSHHIGTKITNVELEDTFKGKIFRFDGDKFFIHAFIEFQYGKLNALNKVHASVMSKLGKYGIFYSEFENSTQAPTQAPCGGAIEGAKDKDKEKDKEKDKDKDKEKGKSDKCEDSNIKPIDVFNLWNEMDLGLPKVKVLTEVRKKKLSMFLKEIKNLQDWKDIFLLVPSKGFTGPDGRQFVPSFDFVLEKGRHIKLLEESNADQPIIGKYDNMSSKELWDALEKESINGNWEGLENV